MVVVIPTLDSFLALLLKLIDFRVRALARLVFQKLLRHRGLLPKELAHHGFVRGLSIRPDFVGSNRWLGRASLPNAGGESWLD